MTGWCSNCSILFKVCSMSQPVRGLLRQKQDIIIFGNRPIFGLHSSVVRISHCGCDDPSSILGVVKRVLLLFCLACDLVTPLDRPSGEDLEFLWGQKNRKTLVGNSSILGVKCCFFVWFLPRAVVPSGFG